MNGALSRDNPLLYILMVASGNALIGIIKRIGDDCFMDGENFANIEVI